MTIKALRSLHAILGDAIEEIERVYTTHGYSTNSNPTSAKPSPENQQHCEDQQENTPSTGRNTTSSNSQAYASPPPSPSESSGFLFDSATDFPSLDAPYNPTSVSEVLTSHPAVQSAIGRIVAAASQMCATVQIPFLTLCDATMGYQLPSCMRLLEASHVVEILREAGTDGLHVDKISEKNGVNAKKLAHILRLLATHHILREVSLDVFTLNRISSLVDSGKSLSELKKYQEDGSPEMKYRDTNGVAAFVGLCTDEIQKASAYMTETYYLSPSKDTREGTEPNRAPFCFAFDTIKSDTSFFGWLEGEALPKTQSNLVHEDANVEIGQGGRFPATIGQFRGVNTPSPDNPPSKRRYRRPIGKCTSPTSSIDSESKSTTSTIMNHDDRSGSGNTNTNRFRLERFGKAMSGTDGWEAPGAALNGFDWHSLPRGSVVVDVGGGIGSTSMLLASAFSSSKEDENGSGPVLQFIIQDRPVVCEMGEKAWKAKCPELLESTARFQVHDFFTPQPVRNAAVFLLRVVLHDWPDKYARKILLRLREAAMPQTKLVIADFVLPLACPEDRTIGGLEDVEGAETVPAPSPLLPNLGKACANVYWMDLTMQAMFNSQERTLRELVLLAASAGWKITKVTRTAGSLFGYLVAEPVAIPEQEFEPDIEPLHPEGGRHSPSEAISSNEVGNKKTLEERKSRCKGEMEMIERATSRCGTPTFGSSTRLSSVEEALSGFGGGMIRPKGMSRAVSMPSGICPSKHPIPLKPALSLSPTIKKKKPSPLSVPPIHTSLSPASSPRNRPGVTLGPSPRQPLGPTSMTRRMSVANLRTQSQNVSAIPPSSLPLPVSPPRQQPLPSPLSPLHPQSQTEIQSSKLRRRASHAQLLSSNAQTSGAPHETPLVLPPLPSMLAVRGLGPSPELVSLDTLQKDQITPILGPPFPSARVLSHTVSSSLKASTAHHHYNPQPAAFRKRSRTVVGSSSREGGPALLTGIDSRVVQLDANASASAYEGSTDVRIGSDLKFDKECAGHSRSHVRHVSASILHRRSQTHSPEPTDDGCTRKPLGAVARNDQGELVELPSSRDNLPHPESTSTCHVDN